MTVLLHNVLLPKLFVINGSILQWYRSYRHTEYPTEPPLQHTHLSLSLQFNNEEITELPLNWMQ